MQMEGSLVRKAPFFFPPFRMNERSHLLPATIVLFGAVLLVAVTGYPGYLDLCVCVVNALARATTGLGMSIFFGACGLMFTAPDRPRAGLLRALLWLQVLTLLLSLFFLTQYVYFLLEIVT